MFYPRLQLAPVYEYSLKGIQYEIQSLFYFTRNAFWAAFLLLRLVCLRELHSLKLGQEGGILFWRQLTNAHLNFSLRWRQGLRLKPLTAYNGDEICLLSLQPTPPPLEFFHLIFKFPWLTPQRGSKDVSKSCTEIIQGIVLSSSTYSTTNMIYR